MKNKFLIALVIILGLFLYSCQDETPAGQQPTESTPPGVVTEVNVINTAGGAKLTYRLPADGDLLYVKALYSRKNGEIAEAKSSIYSDTLRIEGYGDTNAHDIQIIAVDRSRNESAPVTVTINPLEPAVTTIAKTFDLTPDFGGITSSWSNPTKAEISIVYTQKDSLGNIVPLKTTYTKARTGKFAVYGMKVVERTFYVYVQDRWGNRSEPKEYTVTPLYEALLDKSKFVEVSIPGDGPKHGTWKTPYIWNNNRAGEGFSTQGGQGSMPQAITFDLGAQVKLSRITNFQRLDVNNSMAYAEGNLKRFEVWGAETLDPTGNWASYTLLGTFESVKPSGLPFGQVNGDDLNIAINGEDFSFNPNNPKVRFLRINVLETWAGGDNFQIMELDIFGDNR